MSPTLNFNEMHAEWCVKWEDDDYYCDCGFDQIDSYFGDEYVEPPVRTSKKSKPSFVVRGRSIFTIRDMFKSKKRRA